MNSLVLYKDPIRRVLPRGKFKSKSFRHLQAELDEKEREKSAAVQHFYTVLFHFRRFDYQMQRNYYQKFVERGLLWDDIPPLENKGEVLRITFDMRTIFDHKIRRELQELPESFAECKHDFFDLYGVMFITSVHHVLSKEEYVLKQKTFKYSLMFYMMNPRISNRDKNHVVQFFTTHAPVFRKAIEKAIDKCRFFLSHFSRQDKVHKISPLSNIYARELYAFLETEFIYHQYIVNDAIRRVNSHVRYDVDLIPLYTCMVNVFNY